MKSTNPDKISIYSSKMTKLKEEINRIKNFEVGYGYWRKVDETHELYRWGHKSIREKVAQAMIEINTKQPKSLKEQ